MLDHVVRTSSRTPSRSQSARRSNRCIRSGPTSPACSASVYLFFPSPRLNTPEPARDPLTQPIQPDNRNINRHTDIIH
jgi:hypothetical protein